MQKSIRHPDWDYTQQGAYFVTICAHNMQCLFGNITEGQMHPNALGCVVEREWLATAKRRPYVELDEFVVMPNHFHGIIILNERPYQRGSDMTRHVTTPLREFGKPKAKSLSSIVGAFKASVTRIARQTDIYYDQIWQPRFHDHIIRNEKAYIAIQQYIYYNPQTWDVDEYF